MTFTPGDIDELCRLLAIDAARSGLLKRVLIGDVDLPARLDRIDERLEQVGRHLESLAAAQARTDQRMAELAEAQARTDQRMAELAAAQARTDQSMELLAQRMGLFAEGMTALAMAQQRTDDHLASMRGTVLEIKYERRAHAYFGRWLRRLRICDRQALEEQLEGALAHAEIREVQLLDLVLAGRLPETQDEVHLAVEVSTEIDRNDVLRAASRAALMRRAGLRAVPVVAGETLTEGAEEDASLGCVDVVQNGHDGGWAEALAATS